MIPMSPPFPSSADLVAVLNSDADLQKKAFACQQLAIVGEPDAVPALASLLGDDKLADYARSALEMIAAPAAGDALRQALAKPRRPPPGRSDRFVRCAPRLAAVPELCRLAAGPADDAAAEALAALGKLATPEALDCFRAALQNPADGRRLAAAHAALAAADVC